MKDALNLNFCDDFTVTKGGSIESLIIDLKEDKSITGIDRGQYCLATRKLARNLGERSKYSIEIYFDFVGRPDAPTYRERIAFWFSGNFPEIHTLPSECTNDQLRSFLDYKDSIIRFSRVFSGLWDNPLAQDLENGYINQIEHDLIWSKAKLYLAIWELIFLKWRDIELSLSKEPDWSFDTPVHFFVEIIGTDFRGELNNFWNPRYEINPKNYKRLATLQRKSLKGALTREEINEREKLKLLKTNIWWERLNEILYDAVTRKVDTTVEAYVKTINALNDTVCKLYQKAACDPTSGFLSVTWIDGREYPGIQHKSAKGEIAPARRNKS